MKQKTILLELLRWLCVGLAVVFLVVSFRQEPVSSAAFENVTSAVTASIDLSALQEGSVQMVKRLYGLNPSDFDGCLLYYPQTNMEAEELLLLKLRDTSQQEAVRAAVEARLETQKTSFDGYGLEQYDLLTNHSILDIRGNYVLFVVHKDAAAVQQAFRGALLGGEAMAFSTLVFPFVFLPVSLILYFVLPKQLKNAALVVCSLVFFAWGTPEYLVLMVLDIAFHYFAGRELALQKARGRSGRFVLVSSVLVNLLLLGFFKYYGFLVDNLNALLGTALRARELPMPIGVSFFTFSLLSYLFDVYRDRAPAARNVLDFSLYVTFFPKLVSGPIVQYAEMEPQLRDHPVTREGFGSGARLFLIGLAKKVLLANTLGTTFYALSALPMTQLSTLSAWLGAVCYALMLYFDFSGYSDMAIGLASMFGFRFGRNFDYPYVSQSITEFWRRWHISLGAWFRDYVYIPCGGSRAGTVRTIANLLLVWLLTGIWHGANWTFLLWGVYYGILLLLEKFVLRRALEHLPGLLRHVLTLLLVLIGWVFFFSSSPAAAFGWIGRMFGSGSALVDATAKYYLAGCWPLLLVGAIGSFPVVSHVGTNLLRRSKAWQAFSVVLFLALLLLCIALMMNDTYSTFLYFQF